MNYAEDGNQHLIILIAEDPNQILLKGFQNYGTRLFP